MLSAGARPITGTGAGTRARKPARKRIRTSTRTRMRLSAHRRTLTRTRIRTRSRMPTHAGTNMRRFVRARDSRQRGVTLLVTMLILIAVMLVGASAARMALQGEQAARAGRDRQVAFQAAEDALMDGERDVARTPSDPAGHDGDDAADAGGAGATGRTGRTGAIGAAGAGAGAASLSARSALFGGAPPGTDSGPGFVDGCGTGPVNLGLCAHAEGAAPPVWQAVDLRGADDGGSHTVQYGDYSGASMQTGSGFLPFRRPRYLIERIPCHQPGDEVGASGDHCYRVTAIGFGANPETEVVLQSVFRRAD